MTTCQTCGAPLAPRAIPGNPRLFCSDRCRKAQYSRPCADCGKALNGSNGRGPDAPTRCVPCLAAWQRRLARARVLTAIQEWADEHGGIPPTATEWNPPMARSRGREDKAREWEAGEGRWPYSSVVVYTFGTWNAAIREAGFEPREVGHYGRDGTDPAVLQETADLYLSGLSATAVAARLGVSPSCVYDRLLRAGVPRRTPQESRRLSVAA